MTVHIVPRPTEFSSEQLMHTVIEAARALRVGRSTIYVLINNGSLKPVHIGRSVRISRAELERYVQRLDATTQGESLDCDQSPSPAA
jgi:excisionase family DNA binding protein